MKRILFFVLVALLWRLAPGQGLVPKPIPCFEPKIFTPAFDPGSNPKIDFKAYNCVDMFSADTVNTIDKGRTDIVAGKYIHFGPGAHIGPLPDPVTPESDPHYFHAYIGENDFEVVWFEPNETPGYVGQFEKLELGVQLPFPLDSMVYNYVHHNMTSTIEWLNPFDPMGINVEAEFSYNGDTYNAYSPVLTKKAYGFYYREFERDINSTYPHPDSIKLNTWAEDTTSFPFRIRFAPFAVGKWTAKIKIVTPVGTFEALPITFECVPSDNPGFVKVGTNTSFLQLGTETFVPIGTNLPHPTCWECTGTGVDFAEAYHETPMKSLGFVKYHEEMEDLSEKGGNYFRMLLAPWATDIEFEHLNNYSDRMNRAWEVDRILDKAKELDLRIHFNMQFHYTLEVPSFYDMYFWDWQSEVYNVYDPSNVYFTPADHAKPDPGYCYQSELGLASPAEFFTDTTAVKHYKNKLRYMIARWGYSTNIGVWELYSEIDNAGAITQKHIIPHPADSTVNYITTVPNTNSIRPYWEDVDMVEKVEDWQIEMARFIKEDLDHDQHLICANYTGGPGLHERASPTWGADGVYDHTYDSEYIDLSTLNMHKGLGMGRFQMLSQTELPFFAVKEKPLFLSENSTSGASFETNACDNGTEFIRSLWCTAFSGTAGPGFDYVGNSHDNHNVWQNYGILKGFLEGNTFATESWETGYDKRPDGKAELFAVVKSDHTEAVGVISNMTYNFYTSSLGGTNCHNGILISNDYQTPINIVPGIPNLAEQLKLNTMDAGDYLISYYDALTGDLIAYSSPTVLPLANDLYFEHPTLCLNTGPCDDFYPLVAFKAQKIGGMKNMAQSVQDTTHHLSKIIDFELRPNPASHTVSLTLPMLNGQTNTVRIVGSNGQTVFNKNIPDQTASIDISRYESGIYLVILSTGEQVLTKKLVVQHETY